MIIFNIYFALALLGGGAVTFFFFLRKSNHSFKRWQKNDKWSHFPILKKNTPPPRSPEERRKTGSLEDTDTPDFPRLTELLIQSSPNRFPFFYKKVKDMALDTFHIKEMVSEPPTCVDGSNANIWLYRSPRGKIHLLLTGHANSPVCREISGLLYSNYITMPQVEDALLVPGAFYLQTETDYTMALLGIGSSQILQLAGDLQPFQTNTGLSTIKDFDYDYLEVLETIHSHICVARFEGDHMILNLSRDSGEPHALFLPFYQLTSVPTPVTFDLPVALFDCRHFQDLQKIHQQALVMEMLDDALRRKHIYEEWLREDERKKAHMSSYYNSIPYEEKTAKSVQISGHRDYLNAKVTAAPVDGEETYISMEEYYTQVLPGLISEDKVWITRMDELMGEINNRDENRDNRLNQVNIAVLVDAFMRGWPPVFLGGGKEDGDQKCYLDWCKEKRESVWRMIHRHFEKQGIQIAPLMEENTVFQIQFIKSDILRFKPLFVTNDRDCIVYLSSDYGMTYYVDKWSRRQAIMENVPKNVKNLDAALESYQQGAQLLDQPCEKGSPEESRTLSQAVACFKQAVQTQPAIVQEIWNGWWKRYSRDTAAEFEKYKPLVRALKAHSECEFDSAAQFFHQFIRHFPDELPDPYILLSIQDSNIAQLMTRQKDVVDNHNDLVRQINAKREFLRSNKDLMDSIFGKTDFSHLLGMNATGLQYQFKHLQRLQDVQRVGNELSTLETKMENLAGQIDRLDREIQQAWKNVAQNPDKNMQKAREIAPEYVDEILKAEKFELSQLYILRYRDIHNILKGDEFVDIAYKLNQDARDLSKHVKTAPEIKQRIDTYFKVEYLTSEDLAELKDFQQRFHDIIASQANVSPIVREIVLKKEIEKLVSIYYNGGLKVFEDNYLLPEFNEPLLRLTDVYANHHAQYRRALQNMFQSPVALGNFAPNATFTPLCSQKLQKEFRFKTFHFDKESGVISGHRKNNEIVPLVNIQNLSPQEEQHLETQLAKPNFGAKGTLGVTFSQRLLSIQIEPAPLSQRWSSALKQMEPWLIRLCAYTFIPPTPNPLPKEGKIIENLEGQPVVIDVALDQERIIDQFLKKISVKNARFKHVQDI